MVEERSDSSDPRSSPPSLKGRSLFHYTTTDGLLGIISSQTLFATHADFLNDSAECKLLADILNPLIAEEFRRIIPELTKHGAFKPEILTDAATGLIDSQAKSVYRIVSSTIEKISPFYVTSFCLHEVGSSEYSHGLLSQWRAYAQGGFAIEFDEIELDKLTILENEKFSYQAMMTRQVEYENHEEAVKPDQFGGLASTVLAGLLKRVAPNIAQQDAIKKILGNRSLVDYIPRFFESIPFLKSAGFSEENEYRIVAMATRRGNVTDKRLLREVQFRRGANGSLLPYIRLFETLGAKLPIKSVLIGPGQNQDSQEKAISLLLEQYGISSQIRRSELTYRS